MSTKFDFLSAASNGEKILFTSDGSTILGADDKSAVAIILETLRVVRENDLPCSPIDVVITVCEEIGLLGARHLDFSFEKGIVTGVLGTGMRDMHTVRENVRLADMVHCAELLLEILRLHALDGAG